MTARLLRKATPTDIEALHRVRLAVRENRLSSPTRVTRADYLEHLELRGRGWLVEVDGEVVGFAVGRADDGNLWALFVDPRHEDCGHGGALHDAAVEWLFAQGLERLWLTTEAGTRAAGFYAHRGWLPTVACGHGEVRYELARP